MKCEVYSRLKWIDIKLTPHLQLQTNNTLSNFGYEMCGGTDGQTDRQTDTLR